MPQLGSTSTLRRILPALFLLVWPLTHASASDAPRRSEADVIGLQLEAENSLRTLFGGDFIDRLDVASRACGAFNILDPKVGGGFDIRPVLAELLRYLRHEEVDWVAVRFLEEIDCHGPDVVEPLFLDALGSASPNLRWQAYRWFSRVESPEARLLLENAWAEESRPWAKVDLIRALSWNHSTRYAGDFLELAGSGDWEVASTAIRALQAIGEERAVPLLASFARESEDPRRMESVDALRAWPGSEEALEALLTASEAEDDGLRSCALSSLSYLDSPRGMLRVLSAALTDPQEKVREAAVRSLNTSRWPAIVDQLLRQIPEGLDSDRVLLDEYIKTIPITYTHWQEELAVMIRARETGEHSDLNCSYSARSHSRDRDPELLRVVPPRGMSSSRCYEYPGAPVSSGPRAPAGSIVTIMDHFEVAGSSWARVNGDLDGVFCWMPASALEALPDPGTPTRKDTGDFVREFDLPGLVLDDPLLVALKKAGVISVLDEEDEQATLSIRLRIGNADDEESFRKGISEAGSLLSRVLIWMLDQASDRLCGHPGLAKFLEDAQGSGPYCGKAPDASSDGTAALEDVARDP